MELFFVDYDLRKQRDYEALYAELGRLKAVRVLDSLWCLKRQGTSCQALRDHFTKFIDRDDAVCVSRVTDWATLNVIAPPLKSRPSPPKKSTLAKLAANARKAAKNFPR